MSRSLAGWVCAGIYAELSTALGLWLAGMLPWVVVLGLVLIGTYGLAEAGAP